MAPLRLPLDRPYATSTTGTPTLVRWGAPLCPHVGAGGYAQPRRVERSPAYRVRSYAYAKYLAVRPAMRSSRFAVAYSLTLTPAGIFQPRSCVRPLRSTRTEYLSYAPPRMPACTSVNVNFAPPRSSVPVPAGAVLPFRLPFGLSGAGAAVCACAFAIASATAAAITCASFSCSLTRTSSCLRTLAARAHSAQRAVRSALHTPCRAYRSATKRLKGNLESVNIGTQGGRVPAHIRVRGSPRARAGGQARACARGQGC